MQRLDPFVSMIFGGASTIAESLDSANPGLSGNERFAFDNCPVDSEIPHPLEKFFTAELRKSLGPVESVADMDWNEPVSVDISKAADALDDTRYENVEALLDRLRAYALKKGRPQVAALVTRMAQLAAE